MQELINQSITNENFYVQTAKSDDQDLAENQDAYNDNQTHNINHNSTDNPIYVNVSKESSIQDASNDQSTLQSSSQTRV